MQATRKKILVADDDADIVDALTLLLEEFDYEVQATTDATTIEDLMRGAPDLLLLDIWMSGWNGRDICKHLKSQDATSGIPIILISANKDTAQIAEEAGADGFIAKPFDMDDLITTIERHL